MSTGPVVVADHVWKRYSRTMRRSVNHALADGFRAFLGIEQTANELREDEFWSLRDVSFAVAPGEAMAVVGTNGAGKSTLLKILSGVIGPDRGELRVRGRIVSMMIAGVGFHPVLTGRENVFIYGSILGLRRRDVQRKMAEILEFADLREFLDTPVKYYSTGMYTRLAFAVAAHTDPEVFVIDEVLAVGDVAFRAKCIDRLQSMKRAGCALLIVSHSAGQVRAIADHGIWLHRGQCLATGPIESVLDRYLESETVAKEGAVPNEPAREVTSGDAAIAVVTPAAPATAPAEPNVRLELVQPERATELTLRAHEPTRLVFCVRARERLVEPTLTITFANANSPIAAATLPLGAATFPVLGDDRAVLVTLDVTPRLAAAAGELGVQLLANGADGTSAVVCEARWPCRIEGRATSDSIDLQETIALVASHDPETPAEPSLVTRGATVPIAVPRVANATAWALLDAAGRGVVRRALPATTTVMDAVVGTFCAHLPAGSYRQALLVGDDTVAGSWLQIVETAATVGHVDLDAACHVEASTSGVANGDGSLRITGLRLEGTSRDLDDLLGGAPRLLTDARPSIAKTTAIATGERCRLRLSLHADAAFTDWDVTIGFGHAERGRCAGMRTQRATMGPANGAFDVCFDFTMHLARGEYLVGCTVSARGPDGQRVEANLPPTTRCFVLGPFETNSDGELTIRALHDTEDVASEAGSRSEEAADLDGSGVRLARFTIDGHGGDERLVARAGRAVTAEFVVRAATAVDEPSFKFAFVAPTGRCVARMTDFESRHALAAVPAGATRRWAMQFVPWLAGGRYQVQVALLQRRGRDFVVTDRRHQGVTCLVPTPARALGPGLLEVTATVDFA